MSNVQNPVIIRFDEVSFSYNDGKNIILKESSFTVRENTKITIMGQNGAGKSTIFKLITKELKPQKGQIHINNNSSIAIAKQIIPREQLTLTVREYFATAFKEKDYQLDKKIEKVLKEVNFKAPIDKQLKDYSGGQQARLLLAYAIIQDPDILLLDEPTNNLDADGIGDLLGFLLTYPKTVIVISHDADFLNMFTDGVLYLNKNDNKIEQYWGDYYSVLENIASMIEKQRALNARAEKEIRDNKEKVNFFSNKGGKMRKLASKLKDEIQEAEDTKVVIRKDDKTIPDFEIEFENYVGPIVSINNITLMNYDNTLKTFKYPLIIKKGDKYILKGPNGIGKSTLLKRLLNNSDKDAVIGSDVRIGYYSQDFDALDMKMKVWDALHEVSNEIVDQEVYRIAACFLLSGSLLQSEIGSLSEGQKGLLCYARFVIQKPHLLILDEPTNHINFRHLPVIADAINNYKGAIIMVSHDQGFVEKIDELQIIDLESLIK